MKIGIFECCSRRDFSLFPNSLKSWKIRVSECLSIGCTSINFSQFAKEIGNWDFWILAQTVLPNCPNSQKDSWNWDNWILVRKHEMNRSERKFLSGVLVVYSALSLTLFHYNKIITGEGTYTAQYGFLWGTYAHWKSGEMWISRETTGPLTYYGSFLRKQCLMKLLFMQSGWLPKSPCFHILSDCKVSLLGMVYVGEGEPTYDWPASFEKKKNSSYFYHNFVSPYFSILGKILTVKAQFFF